MGKTIEDKCLLCNKSFGWNEVIIGKMPENLWFCMDCTEKFDDNNEYEGIESWIVIDYEPGLRVEYIRPNT